MPIKAQKKLGQNFLLSKEVIEHMLEAGKIDPHDIVVEAGPGKGILTEALLRCARQVIAIEKDPRLIMYLSLKFKREIDSGKLILRHGDILEFEPEHEHLKPNGYKIAANIPYYLTGQFLRFFLGHTTYPSTMVLLVQKEVAKRVATDEKESILSIAVKAFGTPRYVETVPARLFSPRPKVDSAVLLIENISRDFFSTIDEQRFFEVVRAGFAQKRKKLAGNLTAVTNKKIIQEIFAANNLSENARAEEVPLSKWKAIIKELM